MANNKLGRYAGPALPNPLFPETNQLLLNFQTDQLVSGKGFDISYASNAAGCGGELSGTHGNVYLTGYPQVYSSYDHASIFNICSRTHIQQDKRVFG